MFVFIIIIRVWPWTTLHSLTSNLPFDFQPLILNFRLSAFHSLHTPHIIPLCTISCPDLSSVLSLSPFLSLSSVLSCHRLLSCHCLLSYCHLHFSLMLYHAQLSIYKSLGVSKVPISSLLYQVSISTSLYCVHVPQYNLSHIRSPELDSYYIISYLYKPFVNLSTLLDF